MTALSIAEIKKLQSRAWSGVTEHENATAKARGLLAMEESALRAARERALAFDEAIAALERLAAQGAQDG